MRSPSTTIKASLMTRAPSHARPNRYAAGCATAELTGSSKSVAATATHVRQLMIRAMLARPLWTPELAVKGWQLAPECGTDATLQGGPPSETAAQHSHNRGAGVSPGRAEDVLGGMRQASGARPSGQIDFGYRVRMRSFDELFGRRPEVFAEAPGRVNLIGEHTDYNGGFVLPVAIPQRTHVELAARRDRQVRLWSAQYPGTPPIEYIVGGETRDGTWADYVKGMTRVLAEDGRPIGGFDARIESDVPVGSGLSSSAALEISIGRAIRDCFSLDLDDVTLARAGQRAENEFVGAPVGIMDQMACSLATADAALFLDTRTLEYSRVRIPAGAALIVIDSGVTHRHASGDYATRRRECADAARLLGVEELRDVTIGDLGRVNALPEPLNRRARHVVTENARVLETVEALRADDLARAGRLFAASHESMRDDFAVSIKPVDALVDIAMAVQGIYGARLTGGGFGGAIVALSVADRARPAAAEIVHRYESAGNSGGRVLVPAG